MKKRVIKKTVFDLPTYIDYSIPKWGIEKIKENLIKIDWSFECHGKTEEECRDLGYDIGKEWCKEVELEEIELTLEDIASKFGVNVNQLKIKK